MMVNQMKAVHSCEDSSKKPSNAHRGSFWLLYLVCLVEGADIQLLPSTFRSLEASVGLSPTKLAALAVSQALTQSIAAPLWGILVDSGWSEKWLLVAGSAAWGIITLMLASITEWYWMIILRALNGIALATLMPVSQTIIAKGTQFSERGYYFGLCEFALAMGQLLCAVLATSISNEEIWGVDGWRVAFVIVAMASLFLSVLLSGVMPSGHLESRVPNLSAELEVFMQCCRIPTFRIIVLQGCFGSIPWAALTFTILFFQYVGISDLQAALLFSSMLICLGAGNVLGGCVGDHLTKWSRFHGRPLTAQISVFAGIPLIVWMLVFIPRRPSSIFQYGILGCLFCLMASWCKTGVNRPILSEVVPQSCQARVLSWLVAIEGSVAACLGTSIAGIIAERAFGFEPQQGDLDSIPKSLRAKNTNALALAMMWMSVIPWTLCFVAFSFLHFTYRKDVERLRDTDHESNALVSDAT